LDNSGMSGFEVPNGDFSPYLSGISGTTDALANLGVMLADKTKINEPKTDDGADTSMSGY